MAARRCLHKSWSLCRGRTLDVSSSGIAATQVCLTANRGKLFHMGLKNVPARSTLADANDSRDWRIYHALAMRLITRARELYAQEPLDSQYVA